VIRVIRSGHLAQGREVAALEEELAARLGAAYVVAVSSGSAALHLALLSLGIGAQHQVILPSYVCSALLHAIQHVGAAPCLVDIDPDSLNISVDTVSPHLSESVGAILVPHMFGCCADLDPLLGLNIPLIEDCAMSLGASCKGKPAGSLGTLGVFSFYATKVLCGGEGGAVATNDKGLRDHLIDLRDYDGRDNARARYNYKLTDLQAAIIRVQLKKLDLFIEKRRMLGKTYTGALSDTDVRLPVYEPGDFPFRYVVRNPKGMKGLEARFERAGISASKPVHLPLHQLFELPDAAFPNTANAQTTALSLPLYPALSNAEVDLILETARELL